MSLPHKVAPQPHQPAAPGMPYTLVPICSPAAARKALSGPWSSKASLGLGIVQVILGVLLIVAQSVLFAKHTVGGVHGLGFVCGVLFIVTGAFAIAAGKKTSKCLVVTVMVLSIVSAGFTTTIFIGGSIAIAVDQFEYEHGHYEYGHYDDDTRYGCYCDDYYDYNYHEEVASYASTLSPNASADFRSSLPSTTRPCRMICVDPAPYYYSNYGLKRFVLSLHGLMLVFALAELIIAVVASALACRASCCGNSQPQQYAYAIPVPDGQQIPTGFMAAPGMMQGHPTGQAMSMSAGNPEFSNVHGATGTRPPSYTSLTEPDLAAPDN